MVIISEIDYNKIIQILKSHSELSLQCEKELVKEFADIPLETLRAIISKHGQNVITDFYSKKYKQSKSILKQYEKRAKDQWTIVEMARELRVPPLCVCRMILNEKFSKLEVKEIMKDPDVIKDPLLSANV